MAVKRTTIEEAVARITDWQGKSIKVTPVSGGITNPNFQVNVDGTNFFLKIPGAGTDFIDRNNCHIANEIASETGAGPKVYYYFEDTGVEVFEWLEGYRQVTWGDTYDEDIFNKIVKGIHDFHNIQGKTMPLKQTLFEQAWQMIELAEKGGYEPMWHGRFLYLLDQIEKAVLKDGIDYKPCHNDFWSNNMMYSDEKQDLKIIDYEYASMNDPYNDLGCLAAINDFTDDKDVELCKAYHGCWDEKGFAKIKLYKIIADIKWGYWALQQCVNSDVDFDYMKWYGIKIGRLQHFIVDPRLDIWLNTLNGKPVFKTK